MDKDFPFNIRDVAYLLNLYIRHKSAVSWDADCPFCGGRGKLNLNLKKNVFRCNRCGENGGMLVLYGRVYGVDNKTAKEEIEDTLNRHERSLSYEMKQKTIQKDAPEIVNAQLASIEDRNRTYSMLLSMLVLADAHKENLLKRGLTEAQIEQNGYKSTPLFGFKKLTRRLLDAGCQVEGVPGFYQKDGKWTLNFCSYTAGILLPAKSIDGKISGFQIRLDTPLANPTDNPNKTGAKYIWLSSSSKAGGCSSGSPVHIIGDQYAKTIYVTEGVLKADIAHCITGRTFAAIAGANNLTSLEELFQTVSHNGTKLIVEAHDMDKFRNEMVDKGASGINSLAHKYGMDCRRLTWNPNYKGIDDWQLALKRKPNKKDGEITDLEPMDTTQRFRIYQLDFENDHQTKKFAFEGIDTLYKAGYNQPPASEYRLVYDGNIECKMSDDSETQLSRIFKTYNDTLPQDYNGRSISPSDVVELYDDNNRRYYYRDYNSFCQVKFTPFMAKPMKQG